MEVLSVLIICVTWWSMFKMMKDCYDDNNDNDCNDCCYERIREDVLDELGLAENKNGDFEFAESVWFTVTANNVEMKSDDGIIIDFPYANIKIEKELLEHVEPENNEMMVL